MVKAVSKLCIYLFTGEEFLRRTKIDSLIDQLVPQELRSTNLIHLYHDDLDWNTVLEQASTSSLLGGIQVFWISQVDKIKKGDWTAFEAYCSKPNPQSFFVFEADELSQTHALPKLVQSFGKHIHSAEQGRETGLEAMRTKLKRFGKKITPDAWQALEDRLGGSLRLMDLAIDQLVLYADDDVIDEEAVQNLTREFLRFEPFDLTEALAAKDIQKAIKIFHFFYDLSGDMTSLVGLIHWQLKRIWQAKKMMEQGGGRDEIMKALRVPPYRLAGFLNQAKQFDLLKIENLLKQLGQIDWHSKTGAFDEKVAMETFLVEVAAG